VASVSGILATVSANFLRASLLVLRISSTDTDLEPSHSDLLGVLTGKWISPSTDIESQPQAVQEVIGDQCQWTRFEARRARFPRSQRRLFPRIQLTLTTGTDNCSGTGH
jgi:hypothetical protein